MKLSRSEEKFSIANGVNPEFAVFFYELCKTLPLKDRPKNMRECILVAATALAQQNDPIDAAITTGKCDD
jgi:hypothetical protein